MPSTSRPDLSLFLDILLKLEALDIPYVIIGGFAATMYGITRATYDIDMIVDMGEEHIQALADAYPLPRYYADQQQMRGPSRTVYARQLTWSVSRLSRCGSHGPKT